MVRGRSYLVVSLSMLVTTGAILLASQYCVAQVSPYDEIRAQRELTAEETLHDVVIKWYRIRDFEAALEAAREGIEKYPDSPEAEKLELYEPTFYMQRKDYATAIEKFVAIRSQSSGRSNNDRIRLNCHLGACYYHAGDLDESERCFREAVSLPGRWDDRTMAHNWLLFLSKVRSDWEANTHGAACLKDCLKRAIAQLGRLEAIETVEVFKIEDVRGMSFTDALSVAEQGGVRCEAVRLEVSRLSSVEVPFVTRWGSHHFVSVLGMDGENVEVFDPAVGTRLISREDFEERFKGDALIFRPLEGVRYVALSEKETDLIRGGCGGSPPPTTSSAGAASAPEDEEIEEVGDVVDGMGPDGGCLTWHLGRGDANRPGIGGIDRFSSFRDVATNNVWINRNSLNVQVTQVPLSYNPGLGPDVTILLMYNSQGSDSQGFGPKWSFGYQIKYTVDANDDVTVNMPDGGKITFTYNSGSGTYSPPPHIQWTLAKNGDDTYTLTTPLTGYEYTFDATTRRLNEVDDGHGNKVTVLRDGSHRVTKITDANSDDTLFYYNGNNLVTKVEDPYSDSATFMYNSGNSRLTKITDVGDEWTAFSYTTDSYMVSRRSEDGNESVSYTLPTQNSDIYTVTYTDVGNNTKTVRWNGGEDGDDTLVEVTDELGDKISYKPSYYGVDYVVPGNSGQTKNDPDTCVKIYRDNSGYTTKKEIRVNADEETWKTSIWMRDSNHRITKSVASPEVTYTWTTGHRVSTMTVEDVGSVTLHYLNNSRKVTKVDYPDGSHSEFQYAGNGKLTREVDRKSMHATYEYSPKKMITKTRYPDGSGIIYLRDNRKRLTKEVVTKNVDAATIALAEAEGYTTEYSYKNANKKSLEEVKYDDGSTTTYEFRVPGRVTREVRPNGGVFLYYYRGARMTKAVDAEGGETAYYYDNKKRITKTVDPRGYETTTTYTVAKAKLTETVEFPSRKTNIRKYDRFGKCLYEERLGLRNNDYENYYFWDFWHQVKHPTRPFGLPPMSRRTSLTSDGGVFKVGDWNKFGRFKWRTWFLRLARKVRGETRPRLTRTWIGGESEWPYYQEFGIFATLFDAVNAVTKKRVSLDTGKYAYFRYELDGVGRITKSISPEDRTEEFVYDASGNLVTKQDALGNETLWYYDYMNRNTQAVYANGTSGSYFYDEFGNCTRMSHSVLGDTVTEYDWAGRATKVTEPEGETSETCYDVSGNVTKVTDTYGNSTCYRYDLMNRMTKAEDAEGRYNISYYDASGNLTKEELPGGRSVEYSYNNMNQVARVQSGAGLDQRYWYGRYGMLTLTTSNDQYQYPATGKLAEMGYSNASRVTMWRQYDVDLDEGEFFIENSHFLDDEDHRIWDHQRRFYLSKAGWRTKIEDFYEQGEWDGDAEEWVDPGDPVHLTSTRETLLLYDDDGLLTKTDYPSINDVERFYNAAGNLTKATDSVNTLEYTYDSMGNLVTKFMLYDTNVISKYITYEHDGAGRVTKVNTPDGESTCYLYSPATRLSRITGYGGYTRAVFYYDSGGRVTKRTSGNDVSVAYLYDKTGRVTSLTNSKSDSTVISRFNYVFNEDGVVTKCDISGSAYTSASLVYDYDDAYQLTKETRTGGSSYTLAFTYDARGNRLTKVLDAATTGYAYDYFDRMTKYDTTEIGWDYWGNITSVGSHSYSWDESDHLTKFDHATDNTRDTEYYYLPGSWQRYKRVQDGETEYFIYNGDNVVMVYDGNGAVVDRYTYGGLDGALSMMHDGTSYYYNDDALGSARNVTDADEDTENTYGYYAFGDTLSGATSENVYNVRRFTGRDYEPGGILDIHYMRHRYYIAQLGIFAGRDIMGADYFRGWGYASNNPLMFTDPYGLGFWDWLGTGKWNATQEDWEGSTLGQFFASDIYHGDNDPVWGNLTFGAKGTFGVGAVLGGQASGGVDLIYFPKTGEVATYGFVGVGENVAAQLGPSGSLSFTGGQTYGLNYAQDYEGGFFDVGVLGGCPITHEITFGPGVGKTWNKDHSVEGYYGGGTIGWGRNYGGVYGEVQGYKHLGSFYLPFKLPSKNPFSWLGL